MFGAQYTITQCTPSPVWIICQRGWSVEGYGFVEYATDDGWCRTPARGKQFPDAVSAAQHLATLLANETHTTA